MSSLRKTSSLQKRARSEKRNLPSPGSVTGMGPLRVGNKLGIKGIPSATVGSPTKTMFAPQELFHGLRMRAQSAISGSNTGSRMGQRTRGPPSEPDRTRRRSIPIDSDSRSPLPINTQRAAGPVWKIIIAELLDEIIGE